MKTHSPITTLLIIATLAMPHIAGFIAHEKFSSTAAATITLFATLLTILATLKTYSIDKTAGTLLILITPLIAIYIINNITFLSEGFNPNPTIQLILLTGFMALLVHQHWTEHNLKPIIYTSFIIALANLTYYLLSGMPEQFSGLTEYKNKLGQVCTSGIMIGWLAYITTTSQRGKIFSTILIAMFLILLIGSGSRTGLLAILAALMAYAAGKWIVKNKAIRFTATAMLAITPALVPIGYLMIGEIELYEKVSTAVAETTHGNLYSGRQIIWPLLIESIMDNPVTGSGLHLETQHFFQESGVNQDWSAHNTYLSIGFHTGFPGFIAVIFFFVGLLSFINRHPNNTISKTARSYLIIIFIYELFEVSAFENNLITGLTIWTPFLIAISLLKLNSNKYSRTT